MCVFSAPAQDYALRVVKESKYKNVRLVVSDFNFKFYGRFQVSHSVRLGVWEAWWSDTSATPKLKSGGLFWVVHMHMLASTLRSLLLRCCVRFLYACVLFLCISLVSFPRLLYSNFATGVGVTRTNCLHKDRKELEPVSYCCDQSHRRTWCD